MVFTKIGSISSASENRNCPTSSSRSLSY